MYTFPISINLALLTACKAHVYVRSFSPTCISDNVIREEYMLAILLSNSTCTSVSLAVTPSCMQTISTEFSFRNYLFSTRQSFSNVLLGWEFLSVGHWNVNDQVTTKSKNHGD